MTVLPLTPAAAPAPTPGAAAGSNDPADFLAQLLDALTAQAPPAGAPSVESGPVLVEPVETPPANTPTPPKPVESGPVLVEPVETPAANTPTPPKPVEPGAVPVEPVETPPADEQTQSPTPTTTDATVIAATAQQGVPVPFVAPRPGKLDGPATPPVNPGPHLGVDHTDHPVEPVATTSTPQATVALLIAAPTTATPISPRPAPSAPSISDQVFDQVTSLVSRGSGTHRITMKLQPEALGEVRVVLTVRAGAVHVRLAAGQEARAALLQGSPELKQLLEGAGATETRVEIRQLPASAVGAVPQSAPAGNPTDTTSTGYPGLGGGDRSPDRQARTPADHLATDGDDSSRGHRTGGPRDVTPIRSVGTRAAGVDLTM